MKISAFYLALCLLPAIACNHECPTKPENTNVPECIQAKIEVFKEQRPCDSGAGVYEYSFEGQLVYVFDEGDCCCDFGAAIYNAQCEQICFLGGIAALSSCLQKPFAEHATLTQTLWEE